MVHCTQVNYNYNLERVTSLAKDLENCSLQQGLSVLSDSYIEPRLTDTRRTPCCCGEFSWSRHFFWSCFSVNGVILRDTGANSRDKSEIKRAKSVRAKDCKLLLTPILPVLSHFLPDYLPHGLRG